MSITFLSTYSQESEYKKFGIAYNKAHKFLNGNLDSSLYYVNEAERIALRNDSISWRFRANLLEAVIYSDQEKFFEQDSMHNLLDSLKSKVSLEFQVFYLQGVASSHYDRSNYQKAFDLYSKANELLDTTWENYKIMKTGTLSNLALMSKKLDDFDSAINYNLEVLKINEHHFTTLNNLGNLFRFIGDFKTSKYYFNLCYINKNLGYRSRYTCLYGLQSANKDLGKLDTSKYFLKKIISQPDSCRKSTYFLAVDALSTIYIHEDSLDQAKYYLDMLSTLSDTEKRKKNYSLLAAELYRKNKDYVQSRKIYKELLDSNYLASTDIRIQKDIYRGWFDSELHLRKDQDVVSYWNNYSTIMDSIKSQTVLTSVIKAEREFQLEKKQNKIKLLVQQEKINELTISKLRGLLLGSLIGLCGIIFGLYYFFQKNKNEKRIALSLNDELASKLEELENDPKKLLTQNWLISRPPKILKVQFDDIIAVVASNKKSRNSIEFIIKGIDESPLPKMTLTELNNSDNWPKSIFCRIHNSTIINLYEVVEYDSKVEFAVMKTGQKFSVSDKYRSGFKNQLLSIK